MDFLNQIKLIQGGMGVYVSNWRLASAVASARPGETAGTVSGTALDVVYVRMLQLGDPGGHVRRAMAALDDQFGVTIGSKICQRYFVEGGKVTDGRYRSSPMHILRSADGSPNIRLEQTATSPVELTLDGDTIDLLIATGFAEVWLAKQGHNGNIFINFLHKIELPLVYTLYGAMLAEVDGVLVGAGNPDGLAAACAKLATHQSITNQLPVLYRQAGEEFCMTFDPRRIADGKFAAQPLKRPALIAIVSLHDLAQALANSATQPPDGLIVEHHSAGGHNANPIGPGKQDALGQPIYGALDEPDLGAIRALGLPFWLAGGYGSHARLEVARAAGAAGVQTGTVFALADDSGMKPEYRSAILAEIKRGVSDEDLVRTTTFSPTGFAFKVVQLEGTLSEPEVYAERRRVCDIGMLQQAGLSAPDENGHRHLFQRCPAGPVDAYVNRRGLARNTEDRRCLCNGLLACVGLGQVKEVHGEVTEEPAIVTLGNHLDGVRRLSRQGQIHYWAKDVVNDILG